MIAKCVNCGTEYEVDDDSSGCEVECEVCHKSFIVQAARRCNKKSQIKPWRIIVSCVALAGCVCAGLCWLRSADVEKEKVDAVVLKFHRDEVAFHFESMLLDVRNFFMGDGYDIELKYEAMCGKWLKWLSEFKPEDSYERVLVERTISYVADAKADTILAKNEFQRDGRDVRVAEKCLRDYQYHLRNIFIDCYVTNMIPKVEMME